MLSHKFAAIPFEHIKPDRKHNWINQTDNDWDNLLPLIDKKSKDTVFNLFSNGVKPQRNDWVYDFSRDALAEKIRFFVDVYQKTLANPAHPDKFQIKWDRELTKYRERGIPKAFDENRIVPSLYRPFVKMYLYFDPHFNGMTYQLPDIFPIGGAGNLAIYFSDRGFRSPFSVLCTDTIAELHLCATTDAFQCLPLYRYPGQGQREDNITDWALAQFKARYEVERGGAGERGGWGEVSPPLLRSPAPLPDTPLPLTKEAIFHYVYAVLHDPAYRHKYELNLKREFPRIPFYPDFWQWAEWGRRLLDLHLHYETAPPYPLERLEKDPAGVSQPYKARLKAVKTLNLIELDTLTTLAGIPPAAWEYRLGNRSALEWVLDRYKESAPSDPTIRAKFNTYRFLDYKESVIDLLQRVCTVSVETMQIVGEMKLEH